MINIGITGQAGFIGTHLYNYLGLKKDDVNRIPFRDDYFRNDGELEEFIRQCDVVVHLAGVNRHNEPEFIYNTNIELVQKLIKAMENTGSRPHVLFSSSTQEERDNVFGSSKREGRRLLSEWADRNNAIFTGMVIPNVFGPFGNPFYNSVVATFCHQIINCQNPKIEIDAELKLIYVGDLVKIIYDLVMGKINAKEYRIPHSSEKKVSEILALLNNFRSTYIEKGIFPDLSNKFELDLFNTFMCYMDHENYYPIKLRPGSDERGSYVETMKLNSGGQIAFSTTKAGFVRGNHFHTRKVERFCVIKGKALIQIRRIGTDKVINFELDGSSPAYVDMPVWHVHNISNIGKDDLYTMFWINEFFDKKDMDTFWEKV